jgi:hypothetical protein
MNGIKIIKMDSDSLVFDNGVEISSYHENDCCEHHWLSFEDLTLEDFDGLEFNLENDDFLKKIEGYGVELVPLKGHSVKVPGYGSNNGYYSTNLDLTISNAGEFSRNIDITDCQTIDD